MHEGQFGCICQDYMCYITFGPVFLLLGTQQKLCIINSQLFPKQKGMGAFYL